MVTKLSHEILVDLPLTEAMPLFTPRGEEAWVPGWKPTYISPTSGETCDEMLFVTNHDGETTYWTCMNWQPDDGHVRYLRLTPGSRTGFVDVRCRENGANSTRVLIAYELHALTDAGQTHLDGMTRDKFADTIDQWASLIAQASRGPEHHSR